MPVGSRARVDDFLYLEKQLPDEVIIPLFLKPLVCADYFADHVQLVQDREACKGRACVVRRLPSSCRIPGPQNAQAQRRSWRLLVDRRRPEFGGFGRGTHLDRIADGRPEEVKTVALITNVRGVDRHRAGTAANKEN